MPQLCLGELAHGIGDELVALGGAVLVDQCCAGGAVAHAFHQLPQAGTGRTCQGVACMTQIMEMEAGQVRRLCGVLPGPAEIAAPELRVLGPGEDQGVLTEGREVLQVRQDVRHQGEPRVLVFRAEALRGTGRINELTRRLYTYNGYRLEDSEQQFKERMQRDVREHQSLQLLIKAHFGQRERSLKDAVDVRDWLWRQSYTLYGSDYDYFGDHEPAASLTEVVDVLSALNRISYFHPTRSVRRKASRLEGSVASHYNSPNDDLTQVGGDPKDEQLTKWLKSADEIIELIHTPPDLSEIRSPAEEVDPILDLAIKESQPEKHRYAVRLFRNVIRKGDPGVARMSSPT